MDKIIGLGRAGCAIADRFSEFSQYSVYKLDASLPADPRSFSLGNHEKIEDYESVHSRVADKCIQSSCY